MSNYKVIAPENYSKKHIKFLQEMQSSIRLLSSHTDNILGIKDVNSRHIIATDSYAKIVGLNSGTEVAGKFESEMPCAGVGQYIKQFIAEDRALIESLDVNKSISTLNIHNYADGLKARKFTKNILHHKESHSILGIVFSGYDIEVKDVVQFIPNYFLPNYFPLANSPQINEKPPLIASDNTHFLNDYEQEICFLMLLRWDFKYIAQFMNNFRPERTTRTADTIIKKKNYLCQKLGLKLNSTDVLVNYLMSIRFQYKIPQAFYLKIMGSIPFDK